MSYIDEEYYCPNCNATLNDQDGFDPDLGVWTCTECGKGLYGSDIEKTQVEFEGVVWYCDSCGAVLSLQDGFKDDCVIWMCTECGAINDISEGEIYESEDDYQRKRENRKISFDDYEDEDDEDSDFDDYEDEDDKGSDFDDSEGEGNQDNESGEDCKDNNGVLSQAPNRPILQTLWYYITRKKFKVSISSLACSGEDIKKVFSTFSDSGFKKIQTVPIEKLTLNEIEREGTVKNVSINGNTFFEIGSQFPFDADIVISYYSLMKVNPPFTSSRARRTNFREVASAFQKAGFGFVETRPIYDLVTGWLKKDGTVEKISIDNNEEFEKTIAYRIDSKVVIMYHTFKKKRNS